MTPDEVAAFLREARTLVLCTIGPDGVPDPVPMWFVLRAERIWMRTYATSQKVANLRRDPRVSVLAETGDRYAELRGVQLTGEVEVSTDIDLICEVFADLAVKYEGMDPAHRAGAVAGYRGTAPKMVALGLTVWRTASWDHRKLAAAHGS
jgi:PPOX class probable F420-dependent enzyme